MHAISDSTKLRQVKNDLYYENKKITILWGKTFYRIDPETNYLHYHHFSVFGIILHLFGYKRDYTHENLSQWLQGKTIISKPAFEKTTAHIVSISKNLSSTKPPSAEKSMAEGVNDSPAPIVSIEPVNEVDLNAYPLLNKGIVRRNKVPGIMPNTVSFKHKEDYNIKDTSEIVTLSFACIFHTEETHEEILNLINECRSNAQVFSIFRPYLSENLTHLNNNLVALHNKLLGAPMKKEQKIYWNERAAKILIPYLCKAPEEINIDDIIWAPLNGEACETPFQAPIMQENQLQFLRIKN